jgi:hypothetical protein
MVLHSLLYIKMLLNNEIADMHLVLKECIETMLPLLLEFMVRETR